MFQFADLPFDFCSGGIEPERSSGEVLAVSKYDRGSFKFNVTEAGRLYLSA